MSILIAECDSIPLMAETRCPSFTGNITDISENSTTLEILDMFEYVCLTEDDLCNGEPKCTWPYEFDERNAYCWCQPNEYYCPLKRECIPNYWVCDGYNDCLDNSDERDCPCDPFESFECASTGQCLPAISRCDRYLDCSDLSDELGCPCDSDLFLCNSSICILPDLTCNGYNDCGDWSDEEFCECGPGEMKCPLTGRCIPQVFHFLTEF